MTTILYSQQTELAQSFRLPSGDLVVVTPGSNDVSEVDVGALAAHPAVRRQIEDGVMQIVGIHLETERVELPHVDEQLLEALNTSAEAFLESGGLEGVDLRDLTYRAAIDVVELLDGELYQETLERWLDAETRSTVVQAIRNQLGVEV